LTGKSLDVENHVGQPTLVAVKEITIGDAPQSVTVAPISVNIYQFPVALPAQ